MSSIKELEMRIKVLEENQLLYIELIELLKDVKSALRIFVKCGNGLKWIAGIIATVAGAVFAIRKWLL